MLSLNPRVLCLLLSAIVLWGQNERQEFLAQDLVRRDREGMFCVSRSGILYAVLGATAGEGLGVYAITSSGRRLVAGGAMASVKLAGVRDGTLATEIYFRKVVALAPAWLDEGFSMLVVETNSTYLVDVNASLRVTVTDISALKGSEAVFNVAVDNVGSRFVSGTEQQRFQRVIYKFPVGSKTPSIFAGSGTVDGDGIPAIFAKLNGCIKMKIGPDGQTIYVGESTDCKNQQVDGIGTGRYLLDNLRAIGPDGVIRSRPRMVERFTDFAVSPSETLFATVGTAGVQVLREDGSRFQLVRQGGATDTIYDLAITLGGASFPLYVSNSIGVIQRLTLAPLCTVTVASRVSITVPSVGSGVSPITVRVASSHSECLWSAATADTWIGIVGSPSATGSGTFAVVVTENKTTALRRGVITILGSTAGQPTVLDVFQDSTTASVTPSIAESGIANAASYDNRALAPGGLASLFGRFPLLPNREAGRVPWPTNLSGLSISFDQVLAPIYFVSPTQVNVQVPWELAGRRQAIVVAAIGDRTSEPRQVTLADYAPGVFEYGAERAIATDALTGRLIEPANPAKRGVTYLTVYCTGLGGVENRPVTGSPPSAATFSTTEALPTVTIGGAVANVSFAGLAPSFVGLYQVNFQVPASTSTGDAIPLVFAIGGQPAKTVSIAISD